MYDCKFCLHGIEFQINISKTDYSVSSRLILTWLSKGFIWVYNEEFETKVLMLLLSFYHLSNGNSTLLTPETKHLGNTLDVSLFFTIYLIYQKIHMVLLSKYTSNLSPCFCCCYSGSHSCNFSSLNETGPNFFLHLYFLDHYFPHCKQRYTLKMESLFYFISSIPSLLIHSKIPIWYTGCLLFFSVIASLWLLLSTYTYLLDIFKHILSSEHLIVSMLALLSTK